MGVKFPVEKHYVTLEWPPMSSNPPPSYSWHPCNASSQFLYKQALGPILCQNLSLHKYARIQSAPDKRADSGTSLQSLTDPYT